MGVCIWGSGYVFEVSFCQWNEYPQVFFFFFCFLFSKALLIELDGRPGESLHQKVTGETHSSLGGWFQVPDLALRNHYFVVPLDYDSPDGTSISIFAREVVGSKFQSLSFLLLSIYVSHFQFASQNVYLWFADVNVTNILL